MMSGKLPTVPSDYGDSALNRPGFRVLPRSVRGGAMHARHECIGRFRRGRFGAVAMDVAHLTAAHGQLRFDVTPEATA